MEKDIDVLKLLPFKVKRLLVWGDRDYPEYTLELENKQRIHMGTTSKFLSSKQAYQRLFDRGYFLSQFAGAEGKKGGQFCDACAYSSMLRRVTFYLLR